jgi:predicted CxxxxCH...CXXCH cytochrome family protein
MAPELGVHPEGWADTLDQQDPNFHARYIHNNKLWNLVACRSCHGADYNGGITGASCRTCHTGNSGPQSCRLCHGGVSGHANPPKALNGDTSVTSLGVGAHMRHLYDSRWSAQVECEECHTDFNGFDDPLHIGPNPDGVAEINFGPLANNTITGDTTVPNPNWNRITATCSNAFCHGKFDQGNANAQPVWVNPASVVCGSCHGNPNTQNPTPQPNGVFIQPHFSFMTAQSCYVCHGTVINSQGQIINKDLHVNGVLNF